MSKDFMYLLVSFFFPLRQYNSQYNKFLRGDSNQLQSELTWQDICTYVATIIQITREQQHDMKFATFCYKSSLWYAQRCELFINILVHNIRLCYWVTFRVPLHSKISFICILKSTIKLSTPCHKIVPIFREWPKYNESGYILLLHQQRSKSEGGMEEIERVEQADREEGGRERKGRGREGETEGETLTGARSWLKPECCKKFYIWNKKTNKEKEIYEVHLERFLLTDRTRLKIQGHRPLLKSVFAKLLFPDIHVHFFSTHRHGKL